MRISRIRLSDKEAHASIDEIYSVWADAFGS